MKQRQLGPSINLLTREGEPTKVARKATKTTYGIEMVGDVEVKRLVVAGDIIPDTIQVEDGAFEESGGPASRVATGTTEGAGDAKSLDDLTVPELQERLKAASVEYKSDDKKDDLVAKAQAAGVQP